MGSLKDALKMWKSQGKAQAESLERATAFAKVAGPLTQRMNAQRQGSKDRPSMQPSPSASPESGVAHRRVVDFRTCGVRPLGKSEDFMLPAQWVDAGVALQTSDVRGLVLSVRIGIDFGTAYTKASIAAAQRVFFVDWAGLTKSQQPMFLPGIVSVTQDESTFVGRSPGAARFLSDLKLPFLPDQESDSEQHLAAAIYLAWVMRYARAWFFERNAALCQGRTIAWEVNIGCPTNAWGDQARVDLYEYIGHAAWQLSLEPQINLGRGKEILDRLKRPFISPGLDLLGIIPEFVAQITGYARSPQRRRGLHLLVDCGAGTVDVVSFHVHKNPDDEVDQYAIWSSSVEPLGGHFLMAERAKAVGAGAWDDSEEIPSREALVELFPDDITAFDVADHAFQARVTGAIQRVIEHTRTRRTPLSLAWDDGLPLFVTGGGASCKVYSDAVALANTRSKGGFLGIALPGPSGAEDIERALFHRLSVCYGLTFDKESLGRVIPANELEDFLANAAVPPRERPDRDELYPK